MSYAFVLVLWVVVAALLAVSGGVALSGALAFLKPGATADRQTASRIARWVPAMGFAYLFACVVLFSVWSTARGRDWGFGNTWTTPVLGDYTLTMVDDTNQGTLYDRTDPGAVVGGSVAASSARRDVISGVRRLEVRTPYVIGAATPDPFSKQSGQGAETLFFLLDTRTGVRVDQPSLAGLQAAAQRLGTPLNMVPVKDVYRSLRYTPADLIPLAVFLLPALTGSWVLVRKFLRDHPASGQGPGVYLGSHPHQRTAATSGNGMFLCSVNGSTRAHSNSFTRLSR